MGDPAYGSSYGPSQIHYQRGYYYDDLGRKYLDLQYIDGKWYYTHTAYDHISRVKQVSHFWRPKGMEYDFQSGTPVWHSYGVSYNYSDKSGITSVRDTTGRIWWDQPKYDAQGRLVSYRNGQTNTFTKKEYDPLDHTLEAIFTGNAVGQSQYQNLDFEFDSFGNLDWRKTTYEGQTNWEQFTYDLADRLLTVTRSGGGTAQPLVDTTLQYSSNGNIEKKDGFDFTYGGTSGGIHAVTGATKGSRSLSMGYDANGRMTARVDSLNGVNTTWSIQWTGFGKPFRMFKGSDGHKFEYDSSHNRIVHVREENMVEVEKRIYVGGSMEQFFEKDSQGAWTAAKTRIYVGGPSGIVGVFNHDANLTDPTANTAQWLLTDHLGSTETVLEIRNGVTEIAQRLSFDPWGNRRDPVTWADYSDASVVSTEYTDRGFTGHEMLDDTGLVHMNGRIYDPLLGRFLSADPHVQFPGDSQSYNRFSYVHNNPLKYSDPTGYFLDDLWDSISGFVKKYWKVIVAVVVSVVTAGLAAWLLIPGVTSLAGGFAALAAGVGFWTGVTIGAIAGFAGGFTSGLLSGGGLGAAFKAGALGALSGAAAGAVGAYFGPKGSELVEVKRALAHGVTQGAVGELGGGDFGASFMAGSFGSLAGSYTPAKEFTGKLLSAAVVGGTASKIGGGKFENGAVTGAFTYLFNHFMHGEVREHGGGGSESPGFMSGLRSIGSKLRGAWNSGLEKVGITPGDGFLGTNLSGGEFTTAAAEGAELGAYAWADGFNPFGDPLADRGYYDPAELASSQAFGSLSRSAAIGAAGGWFLGRVASRGGFKSLVV